MNLRTVWRKASTQTRGPATATRGNYTRTTRWYVLLNTHEADNTFVVPNHVP